MKSRFEEKSLDVRMLEAKYVREKYPDRVPVIVQKRKVSPMPFIDKSKFITPQDLTFAQFIYVIRKRLHLDSSQALFVFANNTIIPSSLTMAACMQKYASEDGFLYLEYDCENTFG